MRIKPCNRYKGLVVIKLKRLFFFPNKNALFLYQILISFIPSLPP
jgi:hypothetical protein